MNSIKWFLREYDLYIAFFCIFLMLVGVANIIGDGLDSDRTRRTTLCQQVFNTATTHADTVKLLSSDRWGGCPYEVPELVR